MRVVVNRRRRVVVGRAVRRLEVDDECFDSAFSVGYGWSGSD